MSPGENPPPKAASKSQASRPVSRPVWLTVLGMACFGFLAGLIGLSAANYGVNLLMLDAVGNELLFAGVVIATGLGVGLAVRSSPGLVGLGLVPLGSLGLGLLCLLLYWSHGWSHPVAWCGAWLMLAGFCVGISVAPLWVTLVRMTPSERLARSIGVSVAATVASVSGGALAGHVAESAGLSAHSVFLVVGIITLGVTAYACWLLPEFLVRMLFWIATHTLYRVRVVGRDNVPDQGPALLICNHVSYVDGFFLLAAHHRMIRFVVWDAWANAPSLRWLGKLMGAIPISAKAAPRELAKSLRAARDALRNGQLVCIFAEGQISRTGNMLRFRRGFEKIVQGVDAPIIPAFLDRVWGSMFSHQGGRFLWKWPKQIPYPITVGFGKALPPAAETFQVRQAVQELGAECVRERKAIQKPLHRYFVRIARRNRYRFCMADSRGTQLTFGKTLAAMIAFSRVLRRRLGPEQMVGVLLPPSVGGSIANLGLLAAGKVPINLNYTASSESVASSIAQCGIKTILSSPEVLKRLRITLPFEATLFETLRSDVNAWDRFLAVLGAYVLPGWVTEHWLMGLGGVQMDDLATVIFSSGSTGEPKGVMLSHHNVMSNCEAVIQVIDPTPADRIVGLLPLFHSFGFLVNLWVPFFVGAGAVYHHNPLDSHEVGELTAKHGGSILLATPTFLRAYTRKVPAEQFKTLRLIVTGAEKLPREVADAFREKFAVEPLEGYGCTELSPVAAVNIPDFVGADGPQIGHKPGTVGHPLPGVAARIVDPDTGEPMPAGSSGLLLIKGANVMQGYLGKPELTAEVLRDGWYVTGDVACLDEDGFITITDRLSRFSKIGGEMVPHIRIESVVREILATDDQGVAVVGVPDSTRGERLVVLHPPLPVPADQLWEKLNASGLPKLWVPARDSFFEVSELPYLGSGKLDLRRIKQMALELTHTASSPSDAAKPQSTPHYSRPAANRERTAPEPSA